jgi:DNA/RNA-binding domain of Phe-tRNA-synthetase-like protein
MTMVQPFTFTVSPEVRALGVNNACFLLRDFQNRQSDEEFEAIRREAIREVKHHWTRERLKTDPVLLGFRKLHEAVGRSNKKYIASTEKLLALLLATGDLPRVNLLVDIYNQVSVQTGLSLGSHDIEKVVGGIHLRLTEGTESFISMGETAPKPVGAGEYAYIDEADRILCRLEVRQADATKITFDTRNCILIIQGNAAVGEASLRRAADELMSLVKRFCGGREELIYAPWA